jgi:hypothetical protein
MAISNSSAASGQQSPLQLHDIHVPEQVSNFPIAPGWWILLLTLIFVAFWLYKKHQKNTHLNANKKQALAMLAKNDTLSAKDCIALLKWAAMQYFSRQQLAKMYGNKLQDFLGKQLPEKHQERFNQLITAGFTSQYQAEIAQVEHSTVSKVDKDCQEATKLWLTHALPIQKATAIDNKVELSQ